MSILRSSGHAEFAFREATVEDEGCMDDVSFVAAIVFGLLALSLAIR